jgi:hypothetical protein
MKRSLRWAIIATALLVACSPLAVKASRKAFTAHAERLPLYFPHEKHTQNCAFCHHPNPGLNNTTPCVACHRSSKISLKLSVEPRFHAFCRDCHAEKSRADEPHGPVRDCGACHRANIPP